MERYLADLRSSMRMLARSPGLAVTAVVALAMGIGFPTAMFSIVHGALRDLPFESPRELVVLTRTEPREGIDHLRATSFDYMQWSDQLQSYDGLAAILNEGANLAGVGQRPERREMSRVTPNTFTLLGEPPFIGRGFARTDAGPAAPPVVILGYDLWRNRFAADTAVLGQSIRVDGQSYTVIGVMGPGFEFPVSSDLWLPLTISSSAEPARYGTQVEVFGRLKEGVSLEQARAELATVATRLAREYPESHGGLAARIFPFVEMEMDAETSRVLYLMLGAVSFVLLIACANVANLLLARAASRTREVAIRTALGATRRRLIMQQLWESLALSAVGGLLGLLLAHGAVRFFSLATANVIEAFWMHFRVDGTVLAFAATLVVAAGIVAGIMPAIRASRADVAEVLKDATAGSTGLRIGRIARTLVVGEVALATGFLIMTMAFGKGALALRSLDLPFPDRQILVADVSVGEDQIPDSVARARFFADVSERMNALPGVEAAAFISVLPGRGAGLWQFSLDAPPEPGARDLPGAGLVIVTPDFLDVLDARVLRGRALSWQDDVSAPKVALVNESFVRKFSPNREILGRRIWAARRELTVVGVVPDLQVQDIEDANGEGIYTSFLQMPPFSVRIMARTAGDPLALSNGIRDAVESVVPDMPVFEINTLRGQIYVDKRILDVFGVLFLAFGMGALFLAVLGLYAVVSFAVTRRAREIGVRVALGARPKDVLGLVLRQGLTLVGIGTAIGLFIAFGLSRALSAGIDVIEPAGAPTYLMIVGILGTAALAGLVRPVRAALALPPAIALRSD